MTEWKQNKDHIIFAVEERVAFAGALQPNLGGVNIPYVSQSMTVSCSLLPTNFIFPSLSKRPKFDRDEELDA